MARDCSDSDSEKERHDRFKSERNPNSVPVFRRNIPSSLDSYSSRARSPLRQNSYKPLRHKSRHSEERRYSPHRRAKSPERKDNRDKKLSPKESRSSSSERKHNRHKHRKSHDKLKNEKYDDDSRVRSLDKELKVSDRRRYDEQDDRLSDRKKSEDKEDRVSDRKYDDSENDRKLKKHKRSHDRSQNHEAKKRKKEKKHKRKHEKHDKKKSDKVSPLKTIDSRNVTNGDFMNVDDSVDLTKDHEHSEEDRSNSDDTENVSQNNSSPHRDVPSPVRENEGSKSEHEEGEISGSESEQCFGPALPPSKKPEKCYGPTMPTDVDEYGPMMPPSEEDQYGPALPPSHPAPQEKAEEEDEPGDVIGPLPVGHESTAQAALDARASLLKYHMDNKPEEDESRKREAWMLELPEARGAQLGLGPRTFRKNPAPDVSDRSSWTDTPEDKARKKLLGSKEDPYEVDSKKLEIQERNKEMELLAKKSEKKSKSLLEMHQKELKKKKKKEEKERGGKPPERIPFSRENDLQTHKFDEAQKRSIIKKAQLLDSRFGVGESKFL